MTSYPAVSDRVFLAASGLIALHVVDDNFVQPRAGTSAADHLVSGFGTLALVASPSGRTPGSGPGRPRRSRFSSGSAA